MTEGEGAKRGGGDREVLMKVEKDEDGVEIGDEDGQDDAPS